MEGIDKQDYSDKIMLVAEDNDMNYIYLETALSKTSIKLVRAMDGVEAVELCEKHDDFDIILMDLQMPNMNGFDATKKIREFNSDLIIIAQTAYSFSDEKEASMKAGCNDYITKPIRLQNLFETLAKYLG